MRRLHKKGFVFFILLTLFGIVLVSVAGYYIFQDVSVRPQANVVGVKIIELDLFANFIQFHTDAVFDISVENVSFFDYWNPCYIYRDLENRQRIVLDERCLSRLERDYLQKLSQVQNSYFRPLNSPFDSDMVYDDNNGFLVFAKDSLYSVNAKPLTVHRIYDTRNRWQESSSSVKHALYYERSFSAKRDLPEILRALRTHERNFEQYQETLSGFHGVYVQRLNDGWSVEDARDALVSQLHAEFGYATAYTDTYIVAFLDSYFAVSLELATW
ncbi:MAG: hypothetical protein ACMXYF_03690 [Candidatus Woesearchaeota archaeon]